MGCCQSENRIDDLGYIKSDMYDKKMYLYSKQPQQYDQAMMAKIQLQNMNGGGDQSQQDQLYQDRSAAYLRYCKKQLSEIRESDDHMEQSIHYDGSQTKSEKRNRLNDQFSDQQDTGIKEQTFYKSYHQQIANVQPFIYSEQTVPNSKFADESPLSNKNLVVKCSNEPSNFQLKNEELQYQKQQILQI